MTVIFRSRAFGAPSPLRTTGKLRLLVSRSTGINASLNRSIQSFHNYLLSLSSIPFLILCTLSIDFAHHALCLDLIPRTPFLQHLRILNHFI
ncbi:hypothetical protein VTN00DRAFT_6736 [Thermoascus crustaceus]|uniref:uncharacterized protein n=1 Tax=Thermoascus crustaceus TaxID=5088 RepID=UPI003742F51E